MGPAGVQRTSCVNFAIFVDVEMIGYSSPMLPIGFPVQMPFVDFIDIVPSRHLGMVKDNVLCFLTFRQHLPELEFSVMNCHSMFF